MNAKNIQKSLEAKLDNWCESIEDKAVADIIYKNAIITGGAIVNLLNNEKPNDYDIYFKTYESCLAVAEYYAKLWNETHELKVDIIADVELWDYEKDIVKGKFEQKLKMEAVKNDTARQKRIECFIQSKGVAIEDNENAIDDNTEPYATENEENPTAPNPKIEKPKYRPRYFSANAISLSDDIQIVIRFYGDVDTIHKNYDYIHCTCSYDYYKNKVELPQRALEAIINKELYYCGSKYPLCSIIRSRKFIQRGWTINAGQYLKMALQLNELNLKDLNTFRDQLTGVDSAYFSQAIEAIAKKKEENPNFVIDNTYLFEIINRIF